MRSFTAFAVIDGRPYTVICEITDTVYKHEPHYYGSNGIFGYSGDLICGARCRGEIYAAVDPTAVRHYVADLTAMGFYHDARPSAVAVAEKPSRSKHAADAKRLAAEVVELEKQLATAKKALSSAEEARSVSEAALAAARREVDAVNASAAATATAQQAEIAKLRQQWVSAGWRRRRRTLRRGSHGWRSIRVDVGMSLHTI